MGHIGKPVVTYVIAANTGVEDKINVDDWASYRPSGSTSRLEDGQMEVQAIW